jgi:SAM-dependent methyltransferase
MKNKIKKLIPFFLAKKIRGGWQKILGKYYKGTELFCPFCKHHFRKMLPGGFKLPITKEKQIIGSGYRKNCVCPRCFSTDRDRLIYLYLTKETNIFDKKIKLLHVAPESSLRYIFRNSQNIDYYTGIKFHEGFYYSPDTSILDIENITYPDNEFDVIICNHVLEHVNNDKIAMAELYRVLKPGGWAILQVPISNSLKETYENPEIIDPEGREKHFGQFDHVRLYAKDYKDRLSEAGFKVKIFSPLNENGDDQMIKKYAINPEENLYIAMK